VAHPGEFVTLIREPANPYDRNAIRVDNVSGKKVGHIKATTAAALSPLMDRYPHITIDGTIPYKGTAYTLPLHVEFFGQSETDANLVDDILRRQRQIWSKNNKKSPPTEASPTSVVPTTTTKTLDWRSAEQQLDEMFEKLTGEQLKNLPKFAIPPTLTTELMEHQVLGLRWLYQRETSTTPPPFYRQVKEKGQTVWFSEITNSSQREPPTPVLGSILADTMGLGTYPSILYNRKHLVRSHTRQYSARQNHPKHCAHTGQSTGGHRDQPHDSDCLSTLGHSKLAVADRTACSNGHAQGSGISRSESV
jgi:SWI/SNF-related matrix-associated actin-dependent regulator of chromatin subfamily A3